MLPTKRKEMIQNILLERQNITTKELQTLLQTSRTTLYRDLLLLQQENFLQTSNGNVSLLVQTSPHTFCPDSTHRTRPSNHFNVALELNGFVKHVYLIGGELHQNPSSLYTGGPRLTANANNERLLTNVFIS